MDFGVWVMDLIYIIPKLLYFLCSMCTMVIDLLQLLFRKFAGLDTYYINGSEVSGEIIDGATQQGSGDMILQIINKTFLDTENSVIAVAFWSIILLAAILLVITTVAAIIKNEYSPDKEKKNSKTGIVINFFKAIFSFAIIPIACYFGVWFGNIVLFAVDSAISPTVTAISETEEINDKIVFDESTGSPAYYCFMGEAVPAKFTPLSGYISKVCLYNGSRVRVDDTFYETVILADDVNNTTTNFGMFNSDALQTKEDVASAIDNVFMINARLKTPQKLNHINQDPGYIFIQNGTVEYFDKTDVGLVSYYYNLWYYNFPIAIVFIIVIGKLMAEFVFGLMTRLITVLALLLIGPITMSFMPLDGGSALSDWKKEFIVRVMSSYILILAMNIFYLILPVLDTITFFGTSSGLAWVDYIIKTLFVIAGLMSVKTIIKLFNGIIKVDKAKSSILDDGGAAMSGTLGMAKKTTGMAISGARAIGGLGLAGVGLAGMAVGGATGGIGKGVNYYQRRKEQQALNSTTAHGNASDSQLKDNVVLFAQDNIKNQVQQDYDAELNKRSMEAYKRAYGNNPKISFEDYKNANVEGSYRQAEDYYYNEMTPEERQKISIGDYTKQVYENSQFANTMSYKKWKAIGYLDVMHDKDSYQNVVKGLSDYKENRESQIQSDIYNAMQTGVANNQLERDAIDDYNNLVQQRAKARTDSAEHAKKLHELEEKDKNRRWRMARMGSKAVQSGMGNVFRSVNGIAGKK